MRSKLTDFEFIKLKLFSLFTFPDFIYLLRRLGYPRFIGYDNFVKPNFELMSDVAVYLLKQYVFYELPESKC